MYLTLSSTEEFKVPRVEKKSVEDVHLQPSLFTNSFGIFENHYYDQFVGAIIQGATTQVSIKSPITGRWYQKFWLPAGPVTAINATWDCSNRTYQGYKGYIVQWSSDEEWAWALSSNLVNNTASWIGGRDDPAPSKVGLWYYNEGPLKGQPMYNLFFDKCYRCCHFGILEPNLRRGENFLHTSSSYNISYWNNNANTASITTWICEYGGLSQPAMQQAETSGGPIVITNLVGYQLSTLQINFTKKSTPSTKFQCPVTSIINSTSVICTLPPQTGSYSVFFYDSSTTSGGKNDTVLYQYQSPFISTIYPAYNAGDTITVTGNNLGNDPSKISVSVSNGTIKCNTVTFIVPSQAIKCVLASALGQNKILPLTITVDSISFQSFKASLYFAKNKLFYSGFISDTTWDDNEIYATKLRVDGQVGHRGVVNNVDLHVFLNRTLPLPIPGHSWDTWQGAYYQPTNQKYYYLDAPRVGQEVVGGLYAPIAPNKTGWTTTTHITWSMYSTKIVGTSVLTTIGSTLTDSLSANVPIGIDGPYAISVSIDGVSTTANTQFIQYNAPKIDSIPGGLTAGSTINIYGSSLWNQLANVSLSVGGGLTCSQLVIVVGHRQFACVVPPGSGGPFAMQLTVGKQLSNVYNYYYAAPLVTAVTQELSPFGGEIEINGTNFYTDASLIQVSVGSIPCTSVRVLVNHSSIACTVSAGSGRQPVVVTVSGQPSNSNVSLTFKTPYMQRVNQVQDYIEIYGNNFGVVSNLIISAGNASNIACQGNDTFIVCNPLPLQASSGNISIKAQNYPADSIEFAFTPYITSITPNQNITTWGQYITISGRFFETWDPVNQTSLPAPQIYNSHTNDYYLNKPVIVNNTQTITYFTEIGGTGMNQLSVQIGERPMSNGLLYTCASPIITAISIDPNATISNYNIITILGNEFGQKPDNIYLDYQNATIQPSWLENIPQLLVIKIQDNSKNSQIKLVIDGLQSNDLDLNIRPFIKSVQPIPYTTNGKMTITGLYLVNSDSSGQSIPFDIMYYSNNNNNQTNISMEYRYIDLNKTIIECNVPNGYDYFDFEIKSTNQTTGIINYQYAEPVILDASPVFKRVGGNVTIRGVSFGDGHNLTVSIASVECGSPYLLDTTHLVCHYDGSVDSPLNETLLVTVTAHNLTGSNYAFLYAQPLACPNNCSGHGTCSNTTGKCTCEVGYQSSQDCSVSGGGSGTPPSTDGNGNTTLPSKVNFTVAVSHLRELDIDGQTTVKILKTSTTKWNVTNNYGGDSNVKLYQGMFPNDTAVLQVTVTYYNQSQDIVFAGQTISMPSDSVKYELAISNWTWTSNTNTIQAIFNTKSPKYSTYNCQESEATLTTTTTSGESIYFFQLKNGGSVMNANFADRLLSDQRVIRTSITLLDSNDPLYLDVATSNDEYNLLAAVNCPHFENSVIIDPSFSALVQPDTKDDCESLAAWKIAIIVVFSIIGASAVAIASFILN
ncbi:EGF-like domain-containing protein [Cavenderia fasciculata]|uniref:EGF-like domain-containing protein n=1 Tax=Cavenderia fasciculata TaxID=261658 RepID=F4PSZ8_CACFS|nr:EGF-like domain-containing protein [Cavenderia fasciculata]EGG20787.1 EGF-like domain-containing protein [Cavenderia fasciculata]|eukprot:XP_004358637.1 EGF-like domain-containing protein [Cavenderia fasciculata]